MHKVIENAIMEKSGIIKELTEFLEEASKDLKEMQEIKEGYERELKYLETASQEIDSQANDKMVWELLQAHRDEKCIIFEKDVLEDSTHLIFGEPLPAWQRYIILVAYAVTILASIAAAGWIYNFFK